MNFHGGVKETGGLEWDRKTDKLHTNWHPSRLRYRAVATVTRSGHLVDRGGTESGCPKSGYPKILARFLGAQTLGKRGREIKFL